MCKKHPLLYHNARAALTVLFLGFMILGSCPIQKYLLNASFTKVESTSQKETAPSPVKGPSICAFSEELVKAPLKDLLKKEQKSFSAFILLGTFGPMFGAVHKKGVTLMKHSDEPLSAVPLYLKNQVFII